MRCCPLSRDGQIYPIPSAIARTLCLHLSRFRASSFFKPIFSVSFSTCFFLRSSSLSLATHFKDPEQPSKHYRRPTNCSLTISGGVASLIACWTTHVRKLRFGVSKGMLPVEEFCSNKSPLPEKTAIEQVCGYEFLVLLKVRSMKLMNTMKL